MHAKKYEFHRPFDTPVSPDAERARKHTLEWLRKFGITTVVSSQRVDSWRLDLYTARVYGAMDGEIHDLLNDWIVWGTVLDDYVETDDPAQINRLLQNMFAVLQRQDPASSPYGVHPLLAGLSDLIVRTFPEMSSDLRGRTVSDFIAWLATYLEDAAHRQGQVWLPLWTHIERRQQTSAMFPHSDLSEHFYGCHLSAQAACSGVFKALRVVATEHVGLLNDVYSCDREESRGDNHNAVLIIEHHSGCPRDEAIMKVIAMVNERLRLFLALEESLPKCAEDLPPSDRVGLQRMTQALRHWIVGNLDWHELPNPRRYDERGK